MELTHFLILALATWRLSSLLVNEAGPGDVFLKLRENFGFTHDTSKNKLIIPDGFWGELFSCIWCCSLWVGVWWVGVYTLLAHELATLVAAPFAFSTVAVLVHNCMER